MKDEREEALVKDDRENSEGEEQYTLTPWGCLFSVLCDYGIDTAHIPGKVGEHIVEDFMDAMQKQGYVEKRGEEDA